MFHWSNLGIMRMNHLGETCAQALYRGQAQTAQKASFRTHVLNSGVEELRHLTWCAHRIQALHGKESRFNKPLYVLSYALGFGVGLLGDRPSASFLSETERQVVGHLNRCLIHTTDFESQQILFQMKKEEAGHQSHFYNPNATPSLFCRALMSCSSRIALTLSAYI